MTHPEADPDIAKPKPWYAKIGIGLVSAIGIVAILGSLLVLLIVGVFFKSCYFPRDLHFDPFEVQVLDQDTKMPLAGLTVKTEWMGCVYAFDGCYPYTAGKEKYVTDKDGRVTLPAKTFESKPSGDTEDRIRWDIDAPGYETVVERFYEKPANQKFHYDSTALYLKGKGLLPSKYAGRNVTIYMKKSSSLKFQK